MAIEIKVPTLGESLSEATVAVWKKEVGDSVALDEPLVELETDKVTIEVNAPSAGTIAEIIAPAGTEVEVGELLGRITPNGDGAAEDSKAAKDSNAAEDSKVAKDSEDAAPPGSSESSPPEGDSGPDLAPSVRKLVEEKGLDPATIPASGKGGRLTKGDVLDYLKKQSSAPESKPKAQVAEADASAADTPSGVKPARVQIPSRPAGPREERVRMSRLRTRIAERLKEAQNTAAILTTFNEVDMSAVMAARAKYRDSFEKAHGVRLGFMSFFVKASIVALRDYPAVNGEISGTDIVYKNHYDIGVAIGTENGLVVPVLRDADTMTFADVEKKIGELAGRARDGKLTIDELTGGTFSITNGGLYGSMLSTPILNPPQSGILGMHNIVQRPVVVDGQIVIRPMMYVALSYDHRIVDGREAVSFLVRVKECIEDPQRILLDL
jgi:2-oxoglutarate dehydrogenase E2 component (dihydrolipoamide succinyltransferase)